MEEVAKRERRRAEDVRLVFRRIEVEDADVGLVQARRTRCPYVWGDSVLVDHPQQRSRVANEGMMQRSALLRNLDALQPLLETLRHFFWHQPRLPHACLTSLTPLPTPP